MRYDQLPETYREKAKDIVLDSLIRMNLSISVHTGSKYIHPTKEDEIYQYLLRHEEFEFERDLYGNLVLVKG